MTFDSNYWEKRYQESTTKWDIGYPSTPLVTYINQLQDKNIKILIPGAGNGYEASYLFDNGFKNVFVVDVAPSALKNIKKRTPNFPENQLILNDFFNLTDSFDLILEQTFFCALHPSKRENYAKKMHELLNKNGKLVGVFFSFPLTESGPPFGGNKEEYLTYFKPHFHIKVFEECYNSIKPRLGNELFAIFEKK